MAEMVNLTETGSELAATAAGLPGRAGRPRSCTGTASAGVQMALRAGGALTDHDSPGEASLAVPARPRHASRRATKSWDLGPGDVVLIPRARHRVGRPHEDSVVLLGVCLSPDRRARRAPTQRA